MELRRATIPGTPDRIPDPEISRFISNNGESALRFPFREINGFPLG